MIQDNEFARHGQTEGAASSTVRSYMVVFGFPSAHALGMLGRRIEASIRAVWSAAKRAFAAGWQASKTARAHDAEKSTSSCRGLDDFIPGKTGVRIMSATWPQTQIPYLRRG